MPRLFDDLQFRPITYATCMWCHNVVSNPDSVWERKELHDEASDGGYWVLAGHVGTHEKHDQCRDGIAEAFKVRSNGA